MDLSEASKKLYREKTRLFPGNSSDLFLSGVPKFLTATGEADKYAGLSLNRSMRSSTTIVLYTKAHTSY